MTLTIEPWSGVEYNPALPTDLVTAQSAIVAKIKSAGGMLARFDVSGFPTHPDMYRLTHPIGAVLVLYEGSTFTPKSTTIDEVRQERTLIWSITVATRDLGWAYGGPSSASNPGAYAALENTRLALAGYRIPGFTKIIPLTERFIKKDIDGGAWYYELRICHRSVVINVMPDVDYPILRDVQYTRVEEPLTVFTVANDGTIRLQREKVRDLIMMNESLSATYTPGEDYSLNSASGVITIIDGGALSVGSRVKLKFAFVEVEVSD
jgi:hypothetical protein